MNSSIASALAALAGTITGGLTSVLTSWLTQHAQATAQWHAQDKLQRQELYREFIERASISYIDALQHDKAIYRHWSSNMSEWVESASILRRKRSKVPSWSREGSS